MSDTSKATPQGGAKGRTAAEKKKAAAAARAEAADQPQPKTAEFRGLTIALPTDLPKTFMWDMAAANDDVFAYFQLVQSLLQPEQVGEVRSALANADDTAGDFIMELLDAIFAEYGMAAGESAASQGS